MTLLEAAKQAVSALEKMGYPMSNEAWRNTGDKAPRNHLAAVEVRALHRAAMALAEAVRGASEPINIIDDETVVVPINPTPAMLVIMVDAWNCARPQGFKLSLSETDAMKYVWEEAIAVARREGAMR